MASYASAICLPQCSAPFSAGYKGWPTDRNIPLMLGSEVDKAKRSCPSPVGDARHPHPHMSRPLQPGRVGNKREQLGQADREVPSIHVPHVYMDGSYAEEAPGEVFAGYGIWFGAMHPHNVSAPPPGPTQTNNRAELTARVEALRAVPLTQPLRVISDSDGVTAHMHCGALQGRQVVNLDLWDALKLLISRSHGRPCCYTCIAILVWWAMKGRMRWPTKADANTRPAYK